MPTARAIRYKSGLAPAHVASCFPLLFQLHFASTTATHIVQSAHANAKTKAYPKSVSTQSGVSDEDGLLKIQRAKKLSIEIE